MKTASNNDSANLFLLASSPGRNMKQAPWHGQAGVPQAAFEWFFSDVNLIARIASTRRARARTSKAESTGRGHMVAITPSFEGVIDSRHRY